MLSRRAFLTTSSAMGTAALALRPHGLEALTEASAALAGQTPAEAARDEAYWGLVQQQFAIDRTIINLNNGNHCSHPRVVSDAVKRYLDIQNQAPGFYLNFMRQHNETVRRGLAAEFGCDPEELAVTRNSSESLQILQNGIDLSAGDEVVTTEQDYPRMLTTWDQRERRHGIRVVRVQFPVPTTGDDLFNRIEGAITPRTKVLHFCHITNLTGQLFPVQRLCRMARARGIMTIVDGAHAGAQFPFQLRDLECDGYGVSLHKWLLAPFGTGLLYVRREMIPKVWPLQAAPARSNDDIRKFEEIGTAPIAVRAATADALAFHRAIGGERKAARLYYLTMRWADRLRPHPRIRMFSSLRPGETWGLATVGIDGLQASQIVSHLWDRHRVIVAGISSGTYPGPQFPYQGVRVTPNVYTSIDDVDTFASAMEELLRQQAGSTFDAQRETRIATNACSVRSPRPAVTSRT